MNYPDPKDVMGEAKDSANTVLGAVLGAYLGFALTREGVIGNDYDDFAGILVCLAIALHSLFAMRNRLNSENYKMTVCYWLLSMGAGVGSLYYAKKMSIDPKILAIILLVWMGLSLIDCSATLIDQVLKRKFGE